MEMAWAQDQIGQTCEETMTRTASTAFAAVLLVSISGLAFASDTPATSTTATPAAAPPAKAVKKARVASPDDVICHSELETGSRLDTHRTCMTRLQWTEQETVNRAALAGNHPDGVSPGH
jgi:hypothetical protein